MLEVYCEVTAWSHIRTTLNLLQHQGWLATFHLSCPELSTTQAGWLGCAMTLSGCAGSVVVGALLDRFNGRLKKTICGLLACSTVAFAVFAAAAAGLTSSVGLGLHDNAIFLFVFGIAGGFFYNTTTPLYFELEMETIFGWASDNSASMVREARAWGSRYIHAGDVLIRRSALSALTSTVLLLSLSL